MSLCSKDFTLVMWHLLIRPLLIKCYYCYYCYYYAVCLTTQSHRRTQGGNYRRLFYRGVVVLA